MQTIPVHQAKDRFSALLQAVEDGDEIVITRHGKKIARIVKAHDPAPTDEEMARRRLEILDELRAYQANVKPAVEGESDWRSLRDAGRKY